MTSPERAQFAITLLDRIDSDDIGKGMYAQSFAEAIQKHDGEFVIPAYIRDAVLWACGIDEAPAR
jgi:hypothetical protein